MQADTSDEDVESEEREEREEQVDEPAAIMEVRRSDITESLHGGYCGLYFGWLVSTNRRGNPGHCQRDTCTHDFVLMMKLDTLRATLKTALASSPSDPSKPRSGAGLPQHLGRSERRALALSSGGTDRNPWGDTEIMFPGRGESA